MSSTSANTPITQGVLFIHSAPSALCSHVEWAAAGVLHADRVSLSWAPQPADPGTVHGHCTWRGPVGTGATLASALRGWKRLRYEVEEHATAVSDGGRWSHTPALGIFYAQTDSMGNVVVPEDRIKAAITNAGGDSAVFAANMDLLLGQAWDDELEVFRQAIDGAPIRWLHHVG